MLGTAYKIIIGLMIALAHFTFFLTFTTTLTYFVVFE
jgi:hypothetical protein